MISVTDVNTSHHFEEGTDYSVRYTELKPSGLYKGKDNSAVFVVEGNFGCDWGVAVVDGALYCSEYLYFAIGLAVRVVCLALVVSDIIIDRRSAEKAVVNTADPVNGIKN